MRWLGIFLFVSIFGWCAAAFAQSIPASQPSPAAMTARDAWRAERSAALSAYFQSLVDADNEYLAALAEALKFAAEWSDHDLLSTLDAEQVQVAQLAKDDAAMLAESKSAPGSGDLAHPEQAITSGRVVVLSAMWGTDQKLADVTVPVRKLIASGNAAQATNDTLGTDPTPGQTKMLHIKVTVDGVARQFDLWEGMALPPELFLH